jgi:hypothetical protein
VLQSLDEGESISGDIHSCVVFVSIHDRRFVLLLSRSGANPDDDDDDDDDVIDQG